VPQIPKKAILINKWGVERSLIALVLMVALSSEATALSVNLINNSTYKLRAVVQGNDNSFIAERTLKPNQSFMWNDGLGAFSAPARSQTPFVVVWYCPDGLSYSICTDIAPGGTAAAQSCPGVKACKPKEERPKDEDNVPDPHPKYDLEFPNG